MPGSRRGRGWRGGGGSWTGRAVVSLHFSRSKWDREGDLISGRMNWVAIFCVLHLGGGGGVVVYFVFRHVLSRWRVDQDRYGVESAPCVTCRMGKIETKSLCLKEDEIYIVSSVHEHSPIPPRRIMNPNLLPTHRSHANSLTTRWTAIGLIVFQIFHH